MAEISHLRLCMNVMRARFANGACDRSLCPCGQKREEPGELVEITAKPFAGTKGPRKVNSPGMICDTVL